MSNKTQRSRKQEPGPAPTTRVRGTGEAVPNLLALKPGDYVILADGDLKSERVHGKIIALNTAEVIVDICGVRRRIYPAAVVRAKDDQYQVLVLNHTTIADLLQPLQVNQ